MHWLSDTHWLPPVCQQKTRACMHPCPGQPAVDLLQGCAPVHIVLAGSRGRPNRQTSAAGCCGSLCRVHAPQTGGLPVAGQAWMTSLAELGLATRTPDKRTGSRWCSSRPSALPGESWRPAQCSKGCPERCRGSGWVGRAGPAVCTHQALAWSASSSQTSVHSTPLNCSSLKPAARAPFPDPSRRQLAASAVLRDCHERERAGAPGAPGVGLVGLKQPDQRAQHAPVLQQLPRQVPRVQVARAACAQGGMW